MWLRRRGVRRLAPLLRRIGYVVLSTTAGVKTRRVRRERGASRRGRSLQYTTVLLFAESRLRGPSGAAWEPQDQLPDSSDDDSRPRHHHPRQAGQLRLPTEPRPLQEVLHALQTLRGTAQQTGKRLCVPFSQVTSRKSCTAYCCNLSVFICSDLLRARRCDSASAVLYIANIHIIRRHSRWKLSQEL